MGRRMLALLALGGAYVLGVLRNDELIRYTPKVARYFAPPFFQFSEAVDQGRASPFDVGMSQPQALVAAKSAGLVRRSCAPDIELAVPYDYPAALCFAYPATGTFWDIWVANNKLAVVHVYTTFNVTSE